MLERLSVQNLAVVERAEVEFGEGLNVLTGETGAGKSVLMGALELVLGGRADVKAVRDGANEARVEAEFGFKGRGSGLWEATLAEAGIEFDGETLVVRRTVNASGGGKAWVNDTPVTAGFLKKLGRGLVDIHGASANERILEDDFQREALDRYGGVDKMPERAEYMEKWRELGAIAGEIEELEGAGDVEDEIDMLRFQTGELKDAALGEEDETIGERQIRAARMRDAVEAAGEVTEVLGGDGGASELLERLRPRFRTLAKFLETDEWLERAENIRLELESLSEDVNRAAMRLEGADEDLDELDARLTLVNRLKRKYKAATVAELMAALEAKSERLEKLERRGERLAELKAREKSARLALEQLGGKIGEARRKAAAKIGKAVTKELKDLGFRQAEFEVVVAAAEMSAHGTDKVKYLFEPNPGESARELAAIASSGEAARVMLALKAVLSGHDETDVMVFDEIDANIGGETGAKVGEKMRNVAASHQVIAITHLPQSAVFGTRHLKVEKRVENGRTKTSIHQVEGDERVCEIARMLGGENLTSVIKKHAEELIRHGKGDK